MYFIRKKEHHEKGTWNKVINCEIRIRYMYLIHEIKNTGISLLYKHYEYFNKNEILRDLLVIQTEHL